MANTRKIKVPRDLLAAYEGKNDVQNFFKDLENRDLLGEIYSEVGAVHTANSVIVTNGTISSGDVTSTETVDAVYLVVNESGLFTIDYTFTGLEGDPARIEFHGRYQGNAGHVVTAKIYNYTTTNWDNMVAGASDFPSSTSDYTLAFIYPADSSDYIDSGSAQFRIEHTSPANGAHNFYTDYIALIHKTLDLVAAGTAYQLTGITSGIQERTEVDGAAGTITAKTVGKYTILCTSSFSGSADTKIIGDVFINGSAAAGICTSRVLGSSGDVGSVALSGIKGLNADDVVDVRFSSTSDSVFISIEHFNLSIRAIN